MRKWLLPNLAVTSLAAVFLLGAGCGAYNPNGTGGGSGTGTSNPGQAKGFYSMQMQSGGTLQALILPDDTFFGMIGTLSTNSFFVSGLATGQGSSGTNTYSGTFAGFTTSAVSPSSDVLTVDDTPGVSMSGTFTEGGSPSTGVGGTALETASYNFNTAATLSTSTIVGTWTGSLLDGAQITITIDANGVVSTTTTGCAITKGSVTPNATNTGYNYYDVSLPFGSSCSATIAGKTATGKGIVYLLPGGMHQLFLAATVGSSTSPSGGTVFFASK